MTKPSKPVFTVRPTAYRAWDGRKMVPVNSLCWNVMGALWYGPGNQFGYAWINPEFKGWSVDNPKPGENDICPVMEWSGLKDSEGRDIYEGDILFIKEDKETDDKYAHLVIVRNGVGHFDGGYYLYRGVYLEGQDGRILEPYSITNLVSGESGYYKVIGNIFETPELFETE